MVSEIVRSIRDVKALNIKNNVGKKYEDNIEHMKKKHPEAYEKYGKDIPFILGNPDYVGLNTKDESIEYVSSASSSPYSLNWLSALNVTGLGNMV